MARKSIVTKATLKRMRARKIWRSRAIEICETYATWPTGKAGRDIAEQDVTRALRRIRQLYNERAVLVVMAIQRRAIIAFRQQFAS
jgi:hypothetical protein